MKKSAHSQSRRQAPIACALKTPIPFAEKQKKMTRSSSKSPSEKPRGSCIPTLSARLNDKRERSCISFVPDLDPRLPLSLE